MFGYHCGHNFTSIKPGNEREHYRLPTFSAPFRNSVEGQGSVHHIVDPHYSAESNTCSLCYDELLAWCHPETDAIVVFSFFKSFLFCCFSPLLLLRASKITPWLHLEKFSDVMNQHFAYEAFLLFGVNTLIDVWEPI